MLGLLIRLQSTPGGVTFVDLTERRPEPTLAWLILSTFALIGVAVLITVGIGGGIGLLRIWIMRRFPHNRLNGLEDEAMIQLHLHDRPGDLGWSP